MPVPVVWPQLSGLMRTPGHVLELEVAIAIAEGHGQEGWYIRLAWTASA